MRLLLATWVLAGCGFSGSAVTDSSDDVPDDVAGDVDADDATADDAVTDAPSDAPDGCVSFSSQTDTCLLTFAPAPVVDEDARYDTETHTLTMGSRVIILDATQQRDIASPSGTPFNAWTVDTFTLERPLRVVGAKPFGIIASGAITLNALVDAGSRGTEAGAGARPFDVCDTSAGRAPPDHPATGSGAPGGSGGGFQGAGGDGGDSDANNEPADGPAGGVAIARPMGPLGGCPGGTGGGQSGTNNGGRAGAGGGAVYLASGSLITVSANGAIQAGGRGGEGGDGSGGLADGGGGGGGSGGMIYLEAPMASIAGTLAANGGGGGGGADNSSGMKGQDGILGTQAARGGNRDGGGSNGADGSARDVLDGGSPPVRPDAGAGGGGGGAGFIVVQAPVNLINGVISPPITP